MEPAEIEQLKTPPSSCSFAEHLSDEKMLRVSARSLQAATMFLIFGIVYNSILSLFVTGVFVGLYRQLIGPAPAWFMSSTGNRGIDHASLKGLLLLSLFLTPFVLGGLGIIFLFLAALFQRIEVRIRQNDCRIRSGFWFFGQTQRFDATSVRAITLIMSKPDRNGNSDPLIEIRTDQPVLIGSGLSPQRRLWLLCMLRRLLLSQSTEACE